MKYTKINGTELNASKLVLGTDIFGTTYSCEDSFDLMDAFVDGGGNVLDTASCYADWNGGEKSASEKTIGKWLCERKNRDKMIISTKGGHPDCANMRIPRLLSKDIDTDLENSLINLKTDYIDVYWLHRDDETRPVSEIMETLHRHVVKGNVRHLGASNWTHDRIRMANEYALKNNLTPFIASQIQYSVARLNEGTLINNMLGMSYGDKEYQKYASDKLSMFSYTSVARGFFSLVAGGMTDKLSEFTKREYLNDYNLKLAQKIKDIAEEKKTNISAIVLSLLTSDTNLSVFAQVGTKKISHLTESFDFEKVEFSQKEIDEILK